MQIYIAPGGVREGPLSIFQVEERIRAGELTSDTLGWHDGLEEWKPVSDLSPFQGLFERIKVEEAVELSESIRAAHDQSDEISSEIRPWIRFVARLCDQMLMLHLTVAFVWLGESLGWFEVDYRVVMRLPAVLLLAWVGIESYLLSIYGTTPGKAFVGLRVEKLNGSIPSFAEGFRRSLSVLVIGMGMGLVGVQQVAQIIHFFIVRKTGEAFWDRGLGLRVCYTRLPWWRIIMPLAALGLVAGTILNEPYDKIAKATAEEISRIFGEEQSDDFFD